MTRTVHAVATISMDTMVNVQVISDQQRAQVEQAVQRAFAWFDTVEQICTRFDPTSEVMRLIGSAGRPVRVSTLLLEAATFALSLAEQTDGAFDPTVGAQLEQMGFNTNYKTGQRVRSATTVDRVSYRDVLIDRRAGTILLRQPLVLDLNAVVKGMAVDLAVRELHEYADLCFEAGGDIYVRGRNPVGEAWHIGIQHPRADSLFSARTIRVSDAAVCTSGDYERRAPGTRGEGHIIHARTRR